MVTIIRFVSLITVIVNQIMNILIIRTDVNSMHAIQKMGCYQYDFNGICGENGLCECGSDYVLNPKTKICNKTVEKHCDSINDCGENQFCINDLCECQPDYEYFSSSNSYHEKFCNLDSDCNLFDKNSICSGYECKCESGYTLDSKTKICKMIVEKSCNSIDDCDSNQFCVKNLCECQSNYVSYNSLNFCQLKSCSYDNDCNQFDSNRICNTANGKCDGCITYYEIDTNTQFCNTTVGKVCSSSSDCIKLGDNNQFCIDKNVIVNRITN
jgi:hypothetical protein